MPDQRSSVPEASQSESYVASIVSGDRYIVEQFVDEWTALCDEGPCSWITFRPEWVSSYLDAYHPTGRFHGLVICKNGVLRGLLPMVETRIGLGPLSIRRDHVAANFYSWEIDLIHGQGDRAEVVAKGHRCGEYPSTCAKKPD